MNPNRGGSQLGTVLWLSCRARIQMTRSDEAGNYPSHTTVSASPDLDANPSGKWHGLDVHQASPKKFLTNVNENSLQTYCSMIQ